jgi:hypothetical protein
MALFLFHSFSFCFSLWNSGRFSFRNRMKTRAMKNAKRSELH